MHFMYLFFNLSLIVVYVSTNITYQYSINICDVLRDLVQKHEKHPWWSVTFSKVVGSSFQSTILLKLTLLCGRFSRFLIA